MTSICNFDSSLPKRHKNMLSLSPSHCLKSGYWSPSGNSKMPGKLELLWSRTTALRLLAAYGGDEPCGSLLPPEGTACDGWVDSWRGRLELPAEWVSVREPRPGGSEGRLISGTGMRMGAVAWLVACSGKSTRPVLAALMSSSALLLACPCPVCSPLLKLVLLLREKLRALSGRSCSSVPGLASPLIGTYAAWCFLLPWWPVVL